MIEWLINKHIIDTTNDCLPKETPETKMRIKHAKVAISKFEKTLSDEPDNKDKKYYSNKDGYMKFTTDMKARELKANLSNAKEAIRDERYKWTENIKLELLMKQMSDTLRLKIKTDTGKDPLDKSKWSYDDLEEAIKNHAVVPVDPAILAREMHEITRGDNIDETNGKIEDWLEAKEHTSKAKGNKNHRMNEDDRKVEKERFVNENVKNSLKWLLIRTHLPPKRAREVRLFEIASNEGLGLNNSKLINYVRQLERSKEVDNETINTVHLQQCSHPDPHASLIYPSVSDIL